MKVLKIAAVVIGTAASIALIASGVGAPIGAGLLGVTWGTIAAGAGLVAALATSISGTKKPTSSVAGSPTDFKADPQAPIPYIVGRSSQAGYIAHRDTFGAKDVFQGIVGILSLGPVQQIEAIQIDTVTTTFSSGAAVGAYSGWMWLAQQLGACPESAALASSQGTLPGWDSSSKLSGLAAFLWTLKFDSAGKVYAGGVPQFGAIVQGVKVYDPRLDSTYPGGSGSCRALDETTYVYSENPWLHALTFALGRFQNGKRVMGVGMPVDGIDVPAFVEAANIADANGWKAGGTISSGDDKWNALKMMAQAGGGECTRLGAKLSCIVQTPRVSLATITSADIVGRASVTATQKRRDRINGVVPRIRLEEQGWQVVPLDVIRGDTYLTEDGAERTKEIDYQLVQQKNQAAQLAAYDIAMAREFAPVSLPLKPIWLGYKPGDCLTLNIPELGLDGQDCIQTNRELEPTTAMVTMTLRSETTAKHAWALGQTGTAPPTPSLGAPDFTAIQQNYMTDADISSLIQRSFMVGVAGNVTQVDAGSDVSVTIPNHTRSYPVPTGDKSVTGATITGLAYATTYLIYYDDPGLAGGAVTYQHTTVAADAYNSADHPYRHFVAFVTTVASGGSGGTVGGSGPVGSGGWRNVPGTEIP